VSKSPEEKDLEKFLADLPAWMRKAFQQGLSSLTQGELTEWNKNQDKAADLLREYERKVRPIPEKWREYREICRKEYGPFARITAPANLKGRPRKDALVEKAEQLKKSGLSYAKIAMRLNKESGPSRLLSSEETVTGEQIRGLLKYRRRKFRKTASSPEKT